MHLLIPFAAALSEPGVHALRDLPLPNLAALLGRLAPLERLGRDEHSLTTPHEQVLARAWGWAPETADDGGLPFAAVQARRDGVDTGDHAWGLLTPVHWRVGSDHVALTDPDDLQLDADESRALFDACRPLFEDEGFVLAWGAPLRWYLADESLAGLRTASLDRVIGRSVDPWLPAGREARLLRRLQNEVQMLLYPHELNEDREARGLPPVNSFWLSGCGRAAPYDDRAVHVDDRLRRPLLNEDWAAWAEAWQALDATRIAEWRQRVEGGEDLRFTLAGERFAQTFAPKQRSLWERVTAGFRTPPVHTLLEAL